MTDVRTGCTVAVVVAEWSIASRGTSLSAMEAGAEGSVVVVMGVDVPSQGLCW